MSSTDSLKLNILNNTNTTINKYMKCYRTDKYQHNRNSLIAVRFKDLKYINKIFLKTIWTIPVLEYNRMLQNKLVASTIPKCKKFKCNKHVIFTIQLQWTFTKWRTVQSKILSEGIYRNKQKNWPENCHLRNSIFNVSSNTCSIIA